MSWGERVDREHNYPAYWKAVGVCVTQIGREPIGRADAPIGSIIGTSSIGPTRVYLHCVILPTGNFERECSVEPIGSILTVTWIAWTVLMRLLEIKLTGGPRPV